MPEIKKFNKGYSVLNRFYIESRYPGDLPEGFGWKEAEEAFAIAEEIKKFVLDNIEKK